MMVDPPPENCDILTDPCDKKDCISFRQWGYKFIPENQAYGDKTKPYKPNWITFGVFGCESCKHYKKPDLYRIE